MGNTRKNHQRAMDSLQASLDGENKANTEAHKSIKRFQGQLREVEVAFEDESRGRTELAEKAGLADRRGQALQAELGESRALLDSADRGKKQADMELVEARGSVND